MASNVTTDATLSPTMMTFYVKTFLERAEDELVFEQGAQKRKHPKDNGKVVNFTRFTVPAKITSALTEGSNPTEVALSATTVSAQLAEYGSTFNLSRFLTLTDIDRNNAEKIELAGQNMGESRDVLIRNQLVTGATTRLANGKAALSAIAASDILDAPEIRGVVTTLRKNKAKRYSGKFPYMGKISPETAYDLMGSSTWENAKVYSDVGDLYKGYEGALYGAILVSSTAPYTESSTVTVYSNIFHGADAFGVLDLEGDMMDIHIVPNTQIDSGNPAGRRGFISWAGSFTSVVLNDAWVVNVKTGTQYS